MGLSIFQVDAFTEQVFQGNPAAVCLLEEARDDDWLQKVAREMNLSETAFLLPEKDGYRLRWFTPKVEVALCGHATLASAHVLWENGYLPINQQLKFFTKSGLLTAEFKEGWIELNFPTQAAEQACLPANLLLALGVKASYVGRNLSDYLVEVDSEEIVRSLQPDLSLLAQATELGVIITSEGKEYDFVYRVFAPAMGINEDPVTGSAQCCLVPYWNRRLKKQDFLAAQLSERGGVIKSHLAENRVYLAGKAVTVFKGELV